MTRLPRPYIPYEVRAKVAVAQALSHGWRPGDIVLDKPYSKQVRMALDYLFGDQPAHLDHDPALLNRTKVYKKGVHVDYVPAANNPGFLVYRIKTDHDIKTRVRGEGAQHSDLALNRKLKNIMRNRNPKRRKAKIPARVNPWPTGRKLRSK